MNSEKVKDTPAEQENIINDGLTLLQNDEHLKFGTDALLLAAFVKKAQKGAELGAGNGVISLLCAQRGRLEHIDGWEIQHDAAELFKRNVEENGFSSRISVINEDLRSVRGEIEGRYNAVFTNPPYMKVAAGKDCSSLQKQIARHEVAGDICDFCRAGAKLLAYGGDFYCVYRPDRLVDLLLAMRQAGIEPKLLLTVCESPRHSPCMVLVKGKKGGNAGLYVPPVFFISEGENKSEDYLYLLNKGEFPKKYLRP